MRIFIIIILILTLLPLMANSQVTKILLGNIAAPDPCIVLDNGRIWRYNYDMEVEQSWDGSQWVH